MRVFPQSLPRSLALRWTFFALIAAAVFFWVLPAHAASFEQINEDGFDPDLAIFTNSPNAVLDVDGAVFVGTAYGLFRSEDLRTWSTVNTLTVSRFVTTDTHLYAGTGLGYSARKQIYRCLRSTQCDASAEWVAVTDENFGYEPSEVFGVAGLVLVDGSLYATWIARDGNQNTLLVVRCTVSNCDAQEDWTTLMDFEESTSAFAGNYSENLVLFQGDRLLLIDNIGLGYTCVLSSGCDVEDDWIATELPALFDSAPVRYRGVWYGPFSSGIFSCPDTENCRDEAANWTRLSEDNNFGAYPNNTNTRGTMHVAPYGEYVYASHSTPGTVEGTDHALRVFRCPMDACDGNEDWEAISSAFFGDENNRTIGFSSHFGVLQVLPSRGELFVGLNNWVTGAELWSYPVPRSDLRLNATRLFTAPASNGTAHIRAFDMTGAEAFPAGGFFAYVQAHGGGARIAVCDVEGDGVPDLVTGAGVGGGPHVRVFNADGTAKPIQFFAFLPSFRGGIDVGCADVDGDGRHEIVASQFSGGQAWVKVYRYEAERRVVGTWNAFGAPEVGATVAGCDVDGDGLDEICVGAGTGGGPHIRVFEADGRATSVQFFAFLPNGRTGVDVAAGDVDGDGKDEVLVSQLRNGQAWMKVYKANAARTILGEWNAFGNPEVGANVEFADVNGDGVLDVLAGANATGGPHVRAFSFRGEYLEKQWFTYALGFRGGVVPAAGAF